MKSPDHPAATVAAIRDLPDALREPLLLNVVDELSAPEVAERLGITAAAAVLAMVPLTRSDFFGPMAVTIMGGLVVATALTLLFLPALYAAWYKVKPGAV